MKTTEYIVWGINPEPWRTPGIPHRGKAVKDGKLDAYQQAIAEELPAQNPHCQWHSGFLSVQFFFWRSTAFNMPADATNCQKATEDALQGVLYANDKANRHVSSMICEQSPETFPAIIVRIQSFNLSAIPTLPERPAVGKWEDSSWLPPETELF